MEITTLPFTQSPHMLSGLQIGMWFVRATASDAVGNSASCQFSFMVGSTVNPPTSIALDNVLTKSIAFSWSVAMCPDTCPDGITGYSYILLRTGTEVVVSSGTTIASEMIVTISGLSPCTEYSFTVAGISGTQTGRYSDVKYVTTLGEAPDQIMIHTSNPGETDITILWQAPTTHCAVDRYIVEYRLVNRDQCQHVTDGDRLSAGEFTTLSATIRNLLPFSTYEVYVRAVNDFGEGLDGSIIRMTTSSQAPSAAPSNVKLTSTDVNRLSFSWDEVPCGSRHGMIRGYFYQLIDNNGATITGEYPGDYTTNMQIAFERGLLQCMRYQFKVSAYGEGNLGPYSDSIDAITATSVVNLAVNASSSTELVVSWEYPTESCTDSLTYQIKYRLTERDQCQSVDNEFETYADSESGTTSVTLTNLLPYSTYEVRVIAGGGVASKNGITKEGKPTGPPVGLEGASISNTTLTFTWSEPECTKRHGVITGYTYSLSEIDTLTKTADNENTSKTKVSFTNLSPGISYTFVVSAKTNVGEGPTDSLTIATHSADDSGEQGVTSPIAAIVGAVAGIIILLLVLLILYFVWRRKMQRHTRPQKDLPIGKTDEVSAPDENVSPYVNHGMIGNGSPAPQDVAETQFRNEIPQQDHKPAPKPMTPVKTQTLPAHGSPRLERSTTNDLPPDETDAHLKSKTLDNTASLSPKQSKPQPKPKPIKIEDLPGYIAKKKANKAEGFKAEFKDIPYDQQFPWVVSQTDENIKKNRFKNIAAYDHSRVKLEEVAGVGLSDYINASYVKGYKDKIYLAGQGPNKLSMGDIWRMAWEKKSTKIVMLTNPVEQGKRKCEIYWTDNKEPFDYPPMRLRHKKTQEYADYVVRDFVLEKDGESEPREIRQFHFISWPDMGVPEYPTPLINFLRVVNAYQAEDAGLPIIHCSAGVGRTGTFITLDAALTMAEAEKKIDINGTVRKLRDDRINMVQTWQQYQFVYDAVQEALICGDTGILVTNLRQGFSDLHTPDKKSKGKSKLDTQFEILAKLTVVPTEDECHSGYTPCNVEKNRFKDQVPSEKRRAFLTVPGGEDSTNYINACYLDGYVRKNEFIITQMPLPNTVEDFWRMVYGSKCPSIVMLNGMSQSDPSLGKYWVDSGTLQLTSLTVEFQTSKQYMDEVFGRTFKVYENENPKKSITVQQFQFNDWPLGQDTPNSTAPLIATTTLVEKWHKQQMKVLNDAKPVVVHCIDGLGVSGVFCALVSLLEKMRVEHVVDVFQSVKRLRMGRPGMVENVEQYKFLYKAAQVSLEEFEIYENFR
ncbi:receptor-type tyrosine-protein phosphatase F-like [Amphiura filiformis]|uniref:receptor-type tyrosine-protein phosphatase F-like n=1 Tax=Amphiura filiformis TaxID=82378 RepID=UPI003B22095F